MPSLRGCSLFPFPSADATRQVFVSLRASLCFCGRGKKREKSQMGFFSLSSFHFVPPTDRIRPLPSPFSAWHSTSLCTERKRNKCRKTAMSYSGKASLFVAPFPSPFFFCFRYGLGSFTKATNVRMPRHNPPSLLPYSPPHSSL